MYPQHLTQHLLYLRIEILLELDRYLEDVRFQILDVVTSPRCPTMQHLIKNDAQTPDVALVIKILASQYLRSSVERCPQKTQFLCLSGIFYNSTETEVTQFCNTLFQQNICRFDIAMDNALLREGIVAQHEMPHKYQRFVLAESARLAPSEVGLEIAIVAVLQHKIQILLIPEAVIELDYERTGECLQIGDLIFDLFLDRLGNFVDTYALDCHADAIFAHAVVDLPRSSLAQTDRSVYSIVGDLHPDVIFVRFVHIYYIQISLLALLYITCKCQIQECTLTRQCVPKVMLGQQLRPAITQIHRITLIIFHSCLHYMLLSCTAFYIDCLI